MPILEDQSRLLLDTHIWIWLMEGTTDLKPALRCQIDACAKQGELLVSAISIWEIGMLETKGRITLEQDCIDWVRDALAAPSIKLAPLEPAIAIASSRLPGDFHGDPADRIIIATARAYVCPLITADQAIIQYAKSGHIKAIPA